MWSLFQVAMYPIQLKSGILITEEKGNHLFLVSSIINHH